MNKMYSDVTFVMDRSGSMVGREEDTIGGFNRLVEDQRKIPGMVRVTLVQFDDKYEFVHQATPVNAVAPLNRMTYVPRGMTALLDALGRAITEAGARFAAMPVDERPAAVTFVVITDGQENSSHEFTKARIKEMVEHQQSKYGWTFVFLGANIDAIGEAQALGIRLANAVNYAPTSQGMDHAYAAVSRGLCSTAACASAGLPVAVDSFFSAEDKAGFAGGGYSPNGGGQGGTNVLSSSST